MSNETPAFTDPSVISKLAIGGIALVVLIEVLMALFVVGEWIDPTRPFEVADGEVLSLWPFLFGLVALLRIPVFIFSAVVFLIWIYRATKNSAALDIMVPEFSPAWAVGCWFVPIVNLFLPYRAVKSLWIDSEPLEDEPAVFATTVGVTPMIGFWWGGWLFYNISSRLADRLFESAQQATGEFIVMSLISALAGIASGILVIRVLKKITSRQIARYASIIKGAAVYDGPPAPPTFG